MKDFILPEKHCPVCGKEFYPFATHVYKRGTKLYCSWRCLRIATKDKPPRGLPGKPVEQYSLDGKLLHTYPNAVQAALAVGGSTECIRQFCGGYVAKGKTKYRNYIWRYKDELSEMQKQKSSD